MTSISRKTIFWCSLLGFITIAFLLASTQTVLAKKKKEHPFDKFNHEMHNSFFKEKKKVIVACETCHADPESYSDRSKINPLGCHKCHNDPKPIIPATSDCKLCHENGFPKPANHKVNWLPKHQIYAKQNLEECRQCHANQKFCIDCHQRRDTVQEKVHKRNFRIFHSIEARANPRKCDACHTVQYCQECHAGRGTSKR